MKKTTSKKIQVKKGKTQKEIKDKLNIFYEKQNEVDVLMKRAGLLPKDLTKLYDIKIQLSAGIDMLEWVLGEKTNG